MTKDEIEICINLGKVSYLPASFDKRFGNSMHSLAINSPEKELSESQKEWIYRLVYKYRKQLPLTYEKYKSNPMCSRLAIRALKSHTL